MKLINKLLPLFAIGTTAMTVAPIATSCKNVKVHVVKFDSAGGTTAADQVIVSGEYAHEPETRCVGYAVKCWKNGDKVWNFNTDKVEQDITLKAEWVINPFEQMVDLKQHQPKIKQQLASEKSITAAEAAAKYFGSENVVNVIKDDIYTYLSYQTTALQNLMKEESIKEILEHLGLAWISENFEYTGAFFDNIVVNYETGKDFARISGSIYLKLDTGVKEKDKTDKVGNYTLLTCHKLTNVPYSIIARTITGPTELAGTHWQTHLDDTKLGTDVDWKINTQYSATVEYLDSTKNPEAEINSTVYNKNNMPTEATKNFIMWYSWNMWNVLTQDPQPGI